MKVTYDFIPKKEMDLLHQYSMKVLEQNGVDFMCDEAIEIFKSHGFKVDGNTVYMTEKDVFKALETCPSEYDWYGRKGKVTVGKDQILAPSYGPIFVFEDGEYHRVSFTDFLNFTKMVATSPILDASNPNMMDFSFIPKEYCTNWAMATILAHDEKPAIGMVDGRKSAIDSIEMTQAFLGIYDKVVVNSLISASSPCHYATSVCEALIEYARRGQGMFITPAALHGLTCPGSLASLLMMNNAEVLAGVVLAQLVNPGAPVMYGIQSHGCDMRYSTPNTGSPEQFLIFYAAKQMGQYYHLPVRTGGTCSDAKEDDLQMGCESFSSMYASMLSGADLIVHATGNMDSDNSVSYNKFIFDEDVVKSIKRIMRGVDVNEDAFQLDAILDAGPAGSFLAIDDDLMLDSLDYYREEFEILPTFNHEGHAQWAANGRESVTDRCSKIWKKRVAEYQMPAITEEQVAVLAKYLPEEYLKLALER